MAVRIRLTRTGRKNLPSFRIAAFDGRTRRDGPALEVLGWFNPLCKEEGKGFKVETARVEDWIRRGARLTMAVEELLERQGVKLALPAPAPAPAKPGKTAPAKKAAKGPAARHEKMDPEVKARRLRRLAKRASRKAWLAKKAAGKAAAAAPAAAPAAAGNA